MTYRNASPILLSEQTQSARLTLRLRPIKLAFLVYPRDKNAVLTAVRLSSSLLGGVYNPIIPCYKARPAVWEAASRPAAQVHPKLSAKEIVKAYVEHFDPDFVVPLGELVSRDWTYLNRDIITAEMITESYFSTLLPGYGIGAFEMLNHYADTPEFQYSQPLNLIVPKAEPETELFLSSVVGAFPKELEKRFAAQLREYPDISVDSYAQFFQTEGLYPLRLMSKGLRLEGGPSRFKKRCVFFLDANRTLDVIDYWNLRAAGYSVYPVAKQSRDPALRRSLEAFIAAAPFRIHEENTGVAIVESRTVEPGSAKAFMASLEAEEFHLASGTVQGSYPRFWTAWLNWSREACLRAYLDERDQVAELRSARIRALTPVMLDPNPLSYPRYANEVHMRQSAESGEPLADIIPGGDAAYTRSLNLDFASNVRLSSTGLVRFFGVANESFQVTPLTAESVMTRWLGSQGWKVKLSPAGRTAKNALAQLDGVANSAILKSHRLIELLRKLENAKALPRDTVWKELKKAAKKQPHLSATSLLAELSDKGILKLGLDVKCPICTKRSWYTFESLQSNSSCTRCLNDLIAPDLSPNAPWSFRSSRSFSFSSRVNGALSVLLTLRFLSLDLDVSSVTPLLSFDARKENAHLEADLAAFLEEGAHHTRSLILTECKTFNRFQPKDITRMQALTRELPGAYIVFASLNPHLSKLEKRLIKPLAIEAAELRERGEIHSPILILTATELMCNERGGYRTRWNTLGGHFAEAAERGRYDSSLRALSWTTAKLYLNVK